MKLYRASQMLALSQADQLLRRLADRILFGARPDFGEGLFQQIFNDDIGPHNSTSYVYIHIRHELCVMLRGRDLCLFVLFPNRLHVLPHIPLELGVA
jgi:hypothetical protein